MNTILQKSRYAFKFRFICWLVIVAFSGSLVIAPPKAEAQPLVPLPAPGVMVTSSPVFAPPLIKGVRIFPDNPLQFDFIIDTGDQKLQDEALRSEADKLVKYFLATLTVPKDELWVNLSPFEKDRIIPDAFGVTEMGRDLLAQDYILKQLTASLVYPEESIGKKFWDRVRKQAYERFGTTDIPMNTFNKIWIVPEKAVVYENGDTAFVVESHLKIMLEEDYLALRENINNDKYGTDQVTDKTAEDINELSSQIVREILIPEIEKEVNGGENFANLRQIYHSMILATWFKRNLKQSILNKIYVDQNKIDGVDVKDKDIKNKIYQQYLEAFKTGVYNYIKEEYDPTTQEIIPRKYFSGGFEGQALDKAMVVSDNPAHALSVASDIERALIASVRLRPRGEGFIQDNAIDVAILSEKNFESAEALDTLDPTRSTRDEIQDRVAHFPERGWAIVSDGMGGHAAGAEAARITIASAEKVLQLDNIQKASHSQEAMRDLLESVARAASAAMAEDESKNVDNRGMGATITLGLIYEDPNGQKWLAVLNMGDSRLYYVTESGDVTQLTRDDRLVQGLIELGLITEQQAETDDRKNTLTAAITAKPIQFFEDHQIQFFKINFGDSFYGLSDGVYENLTNGERIDAFKSNTSPEQVVKIIIEKAKVNRFKNDDMGAVGLKLLKPVDVAMTSSKGLLAIEQLRAMYPQQVAYDKSVDGAHFVRGSIAVRDPDDPNQQIERSFQVTVNKEGWSATLFDEQTKALILEDDTQEGFHLVEAEGGIEDNYLNPVREARIPADYLSEFALDVPGRFVISFSDEARGELESQGWKLVTSLSNLKDDQRFVLTNHSVLTQYRRFQSADEDVFASLQKGEDADEAMTADAARDKWQWFKSVTADGRSLYQTENGLTLIGLTPRISDNMFDIEGTEGRFWIEVSERRLRPIQAGDVVHNAAEIDINIRGPNGDVHFPMHNVRSIEVTRPDKTKPPRQISISHYAPNIGTVKTVILFNGDIAGEINVHQEIVGAERLFETATNDDVVFDKNPVSGFKTLSYKGVPVVIYDDREAYLLNGDLNPNRFLFYHQGKAVTIDAAGAVQIFAPKREIPITEQTLSSLRDGLVSTQVELKFTSIQNGQSTERAITITGPIQWYRLLEAEGRLQIVINGKMWDLSTTFDPSSIKLENFDGFAPVLSVVDTAMAEDTVGDEAMTVGRLFNFKRKSGDKWDMTEEEVHRLLGELWGEINSLDTRLIQQIEDYVPQKGDSFPEITSKALAGSRPSQLDENIFIYLPRLDIAGNEFMILYKDKPLIKIELGHTDRNIAELNWIWLHPRIRHNRFGTRLLLNVLKFLQWKNYSSVHIISSGDAIGYWDRFGVRISFEGDNNYDIDNLTSRVSAYLETEPQGDEMIAVDDSRPRTQDSAMTAPGGIDFNPDLLEIERRGAGVEFNLPEELKKLETMPINGFAPIIYSITPITNLPLLLGIVDEKRPEPIADAEEDSMRFSKGIRISEDQAIGKPMS